MEKQNLFILPKKIYRNEQLANSKKKHEGQEFPEKLRAHEVSYL